MASSTRSKKRENSSNFSNSPAKLIFADDQKPEMSRLKVRVKQWNAVGVWRWQTDDDDCGICRMPFHACCSDCKIPGDDCPVVWGQCKHCFHLHCISKWLSAHTQQQCPLCRQEWKYKE